MKTLKDFENEINKCSKCGLCQAVCPLYKLTGNDCAVSKGKFVMLDGVVKGDLTLNKTIDKYIEMCLKCGKCTDFCPSGINVCEIFKTAKHDYIKNTKTGKLISFLQSEKVFDKAVDIIGNLNKTKHNTTSKSPVKTLLFFKGCANKVVPNSEKNLKHILSQLPYNLIEKDFKCCGVPFASSGNLERYEAVKKYNSQIINETECDYVITDCASCAAELSNYKNINKPILNFVEFLAQENIKFKLDKKYKITFHKPCHLKNYEAVKKIIANCENTEYTQMPDFDTCCGFAGQFAITNRKLSKELSKLKIKNALSTNPDIILTACPACVAGLTQGMFYMKKTTKTPKIMNMTEFLALANPYL